MTEQEHYSTLGINSSVIKITQNTDIPLNKYDWAYIEGPTQLHNKLTDINYFERISSNVKYVGVVYHTTQTNTRIKTRIHHTARNLDAFFKKILVNSFIKNNYYYAILATHRRHAWSFITCEELMKASLELIKHIPDNITAVVGIHRSGTPVAAIISAILHLPCYIYSDRDGLILINGGGRTLNLKEREGIRLVIDDTVCKGDSITRAKKWFYKNDPQNKYIFAAVFPSPEGVVFVDYYSKILNRPHILEWNLLNCSHITKSLIDLDGVLCFDPPFFDETNKEERTNYLDWIKAATVRYPARHLELGEIVSYRCEYTRIATEEWLKRNNIKYKSLQLFPGKPEERTFQANQWKGKIYKQSKFKLFIESSTKQAQDIFQFTKKPVLDLERKILLK